MKEIVTTNLADMPLSQVESLVKAWAKSGLPDDFDQDGVNISYNTRSGYIFLSNSNCDVAMENSRGELESFYNTPYQGFEGFFDELASDFDQMHKDDQEFMRDLAKRLDREDELPEEPQDPEDQDDDQDDQENKDKESEDENEKKPVRAFQEIPLVDRILSLLNIQ